MGLLALATLAAAFAGCRSQSGPYYGLPVGSLYYTADETKGDIYASDPRTIMAVNFKQKARAGCTSFMAGPPKADVSGVDGNAAGVLLPVRVRSGDLRRSEDGTARVKRGVNLGVGFPWGVAGFASLNSNFLNAAAFNSEFGNLRLGEDTPQGSPDSGVSFDGIDLDVGAGEEGGWFAPEPIGPQLPPVLTTPRAPVTRIRVMDFPKAKKMMPIAEIMKMRAAAKETTANPARIYPTTPGINAAVIQNVEEKPANGIIVFDAEEDVIIKSTLKQEVNMGQFGFPTVRQDRNPPTLAPKKRVTPRRATPRVNRRRPLTRRPQSSFRRNGVATTAAPRRRFTFPPAHEMPGWTPTQSYRRRSRRPTPAPVQRQPQRPFRVVRRRTTPTTKIPTTTTTTTTPAPSTTTSQEEIAETTTVPIQILGQAKSASGERIPTRGDRVETTVAGVVDVTTTEVPLPVIKETVEENKNDGFRLHFFPTIPPTNETSAEIGEGLIMVDPNSNETAVAPADVHAAFKGRLPRYPELYERIDGDLLFFHSDPKTTSTAPTTTTEAAPTTEGDISSTTAHIPTETTAAVTEEAAEEESKEENAAVEKIALSDLEWFVVEDPRAGRRKPSTPPTTLNPDAPTPLPNSEPIATTEPPPELPEPEIGSIYALPQIDGETLLVEIPPEYSLNDFQWFGVYDHCKGTRTAFVSLKDIRPPAEAVLPDGIKGWQYDTASKEITVINCNTIRLNGFTFSGHNHTNSYVYVGTGEFPELIQQHVRAAVIGQREDEPLRDYKDEDILVKLPDGWKTFDIDFVSIFNPADRTSYGHATIPPVVVPPCEDVFSP